MSKTAEKAGTVAGVEKSILEEAQRLLGTPTQKDTVNAALREVVRRKLIDEFFTRMSEDDPEDFDRIRGEVWQ